MGKGARAYEYRFLTPYNGIQLHELNRARMTGQQYEQFTLQAEAMLRSKYTEALDGSANHAGSSCWASAVFHLYDLPSAPSYVCQRRGRGRRTRAGADCLERVSGWRRLRQVQSASSGLVPQCCRR